MVLKGDIDEIRFRNDENGYTILVLDAGGEPVVCVGAFPPVCEGESVELSGEYVMHPRFGKQFKTESVKTFTPESDDGVIRYLGSGLIKGLGPKTAFSIVAQFGQDALKVIEFEPHRLASVRGISKDKALHFGAEYGKIKIMRNAVMYLQRLGISLNLAFKIYKTYGADTEAVVASNPYLLIEDVDGVGFLTADRIAAESGIQKDSAFRVRAGVIYTLKEAAERGGNTYLPKEETAALSAKLLNLSQDRAAQEIENLVLNRKLRAVRCADEGGDNGEGVMLAALYHVEKSAAVKLAQMLNCANMLRRDPQSLIDSFEQIEKIKLSPAQREAVTESVNSAVSVITGGPGTGKTTIVKCILYVLDAWGVDAMLTAPTGRAAKRLCESTGAQASTIHRALLSAGGEPFSCGAVIVDEVSMVDIYLMHTLLNSLRAETKLILVGDKDQLPSVGAGSVLSDILSSGLFNVIALDRVYRQGEQSLIVENAHRINAGVMPELGSRDRDFFFAEASSPDEVADKTVSLIAERLPAFLNCAATKIQILCPMKNGAAGTLRLNERLRAVLNENRDRRAVEGEGQAFRAGDKVMHIANNYELSWRRIAGRFTESGEGVFNGDAGVVESVQPSTGEITVLFEDGRSAVYTPDIRAQLILAYAVTVHKSQGSEFEAVIVPIVSGSPAMLTRNLLYTAVTRARRLVVLVGERHNIKRMVENNYIQKRYSYLKRFMQEAAKKDRLLYS
ncbi:MAG: ATP-dependent RecD-like DNA helicase [Firmicutes bacterium]|nr:ATP-dependent RecD-like DNA helicase [Bacillota bacterium]